VSRGISPIPE
jgi:hypothetical protein